MLSVPLTQAPNPTMFGERTCRIQNYDGSAVAALPKRPRQDPALSGSSHGDNPGTLEELKNNTHVFIFKNLQ